MQEIVDGLVWGVPVVGILFALIRLFKGRLDAVVWNGFTLTQLLLALTVGGGSTLALYANVLATSFPVLPEVVKGVAAFLVPTLAFLGVWKEFAYSTQIVRDRVFYNKKKLE